MTVQSSSRPLIKPLRWTELRTVLPHESNDFTPWLADNLDLLAEVLGLEDLQLVGTEASVEDYRLDIRANGTDGSGDEIAVIVENQYGRSNHDHLGKLVTYAAKADVEGERVLAVWIAEEPTKAHTAAVDFLNRTSTESVGWVLLSVRFAPAPDGYYVHFETFSEPNEFLREGTPSSGSIEQPERATFVRDLTERISGPLKDAGFRHVWNHPRGTIVRAYLPDRLPAADWIEVRVLAAKQRVRAVLFVRGGRIAQADDNSRVLAGLRARHGEAISQRLSDPQSLEWHARKVGDRSDYARYSLEGVGYQAPDVEAAATRVIEFACAVLDAAREDGREELPHLDDLETPSTTADAETVKAIVRHVEAGEWTSYGDVSTVAIGVHTAAMAVGNMAATMPDFPNPHRVLRGDGSVPTDWEDDAGQGPEECQRRLEAEGVRFTDNRTADPSARVPLEVLRARFESE